MDVISCNQISSIIHLPLWIALILIETIFQHIGYEVAGRQGLKSFIPILKLYCRKYCNKINHKTSYIVIYMLNQRCSKYLELEITTHPWKSFEYFWYWTRNEFSEWLPPSLQTTIRIIVLDKIVEGCIIALIFCKYSLSLFLYFFLLEF